MKGKVVASRKHRVEMWWFCLRATVHVESVLFCFVYFIATKNAPCVSTAVGSRAATGVSGGGVSSPCYLSRVGTYLAHSYISSSRFS